MILPVDVKETVRLLQVKQADAYSPLGLCFGINWMEGQHVFSYIVTGKHVVDDPLRRGQDIFLRSNAAGSQADYAILLPSRWVYHSDPAVDLAVLPRSGLADTYPMTIAALPADSIVTPDRLLAPLEEGNAVCVMTLLDPYRQIAPSKLVVRQGHIALLSDERLTGPFGPALYHLIECATNPGDSGSPVFMPAQSPNGQASLAVVGVVSAAYPLHAPTSSNGWPRSGLALVTPGQFILEVLQQAELADLRMQGLGAGRIRRVQPKLRSN